MKKIRVISIASEDGSLDREEIIFTDDFKSPASDFFNLDGMLILTDEIINDNLPSSFGRNIVFINPISLNLNYYR